MRMIEIDYEAQPPIDGYGPGGFRIGGQWYAHNTLILPAGISAVGGVDAEGIAPVLAAADTIDVLLVGQGADIAPLPRDLRTALEEAAIGVEEMSTSAACRTYNVLLTEDRRVAALLLAV